MKVLCTMVISVMILVSSLPSASRAQLQFQDLLTAEQMRSAGLHKLTQSEINALNLYLNAIVNVALENYGSSSTDSYSPGTSPTTSVVIESRISGEFTGWDGETIFKLMNGQIWQQTSYAYHYHYAYMPEVTIYKVGTQYKMKVEGVSASIYVKRIR